MTEFVGRAAEMESAFASLASARGFLVTGPSGCGRSRLLTEVLARHAAAGGRCVELRTGGARSAIPFAGFLHLLPDDAADGLPELAIAVRRHLLAVASDDTLVLAVDDLHDLDAPSIGMVQHLLRDGGFALAATIRTGEARPEGLDQLWYDTEIQRIELGPFVPDDVARLLTSELGDPAHPSLVGSVAAATGGSAALTIAVSADARECGALRHDDDGWSLDDEFGSIAEAAGARTADAVRLVVDRLDEEERRLVRLLATAGVLHPELIPRASRPALERLEERSLVEVDAGPDDAWTIRLRQPVVGTTLDRTGATGGRFAVLEELLELTRGTGTDATRIAVWAEEIGASLDSSEWLAASDAAMAAFDQSTALRWAERARDADPSSHEAHRALGRLQRLEGDAASATESFRAARACARDDEQFALAAIDLAGMVALDLHDPAAAIDDLLATAEIVDDPSRGLALRSEAAVMATLLGRFDDVLLSRPTAAQLASADGPTRWLLGLNEVYARTMLGRLDGIDGLVEGTRGAFRTIEGERPQELDSLVGLHVAGLMQRGELRRVMATVESWEGRRRAGEYRGVQSIILALVAREMGDQRATDFASDACEQHDWLDAIGTAPLAYAAASIVAADADELEAAHALAERSGEVGSEPWRTIWSGRAHARVAHRTGDVERAIARCTAAAEVALSSSHVVYAAVTAHDLVEYGDPGAAARLLGAAIASMEESHFFDLLLAHAEAVAGGDFDALDESGRAFRRIGARRLEASCHRDAVRVALGSGDVVRARWADALARRAEGPSVAAPGADDALTDRECEIAFLAATETTSREIADRLGLSARTVDNHLRRVYRKLGIGGRSELASLAD